VTYYFKDVNRSFRGYTNITKKSVSGKLLTTAHLFQVNKIDKFSSALSLIKGVLANLIYIWHVVIYEHLLLREVFELFAK
jgi:hypothetical protein